MMNREETVSTDTWLSDTVRPLVDERIRNRLDDQYKTNKLWYQFDTGGKRIRPGMTLLASRLAGLDRDIAVDIACSVEMLHTFSLIHDDVMDGDSWRRSEPTVWEQYGTDQAINIGNALYTCALSTLPDELMKPACSTVQRMCTGQQMDMEFEDRRDVTIDEYMTMVEHKTGALIRFAVTGPEQLVDTTLGLADLQWLGVAFQIRDDLLDFESGKGRSTVGNDVRAGKRTLLAVHADDERVYDVLDKPFEDTTKADVQRVATHYKEQGSFKYASKKMSELSQRSEDAIDRVSDDQVRSKLHDIRAFVINRDG